MTNWGPVGPRGTIPDRGRYQPRLGGLMLVIVVIALGLALPELAMALLVASAAIILAGALLILMIGLAMAISTVLHPIGSGWKRPALVGTPGAPGRVAGASAVAGSGGEGAVG